MRSIYRTPRTIPLVRKVAGCVVSRVCRSEISLPPIGLLSERTPDLDRPVRILDCRDAHSRVRPLMGNVVKMRYAPEQVGFFCASLHDPGVILYGDLGQKLLHDAVQSPDAMVDFGSTIFPTDISNIIYLEAIQTHEVVHLIQLGKTPGVRGIFPEQDVLSDQLASRAKLAEPLGGSATVGHRMYKACMMEYHACKISGIIYPTLQHAIGVSTAKFMDFFREIYWQECVRIHLDRIQTVHQLMAWSNWWETLNTAHLESLRGAPIE